MESPFLLEKEEASLDITEAKQQGLRIIRPNLPRRERAFPLLEQRIAAVYLLYCANFYEKQLSKMFKVSERTIRRYISKSKSIYSVSKME